VSRKTRVPLSAVLNCVEMEEQAADLWTGCDFGCAYCLPVARRWARKYRVPVGTGLAQTHVLPRTLPDPLNLVGLSGRRGPMPPVFLSLMSDPYPQAEEAAGVTRHAIERLHSYGVGVRVLTKSGTRAVRDFQPRRGTDQDGPNLGSHPDDAFGATLTFLDEGQSRKWEPRAASPAERIAGLKEAHRRGIPTWASLTPVMDPEQALELIRLTSAFVDLYSLGAAENIGAGAPSFSYLAFGYEVIHLCRRLGASVFMRKEGKNMAGCRELARQTEEIDKMMSDSRWAEVCRARKPRWVRTTSGRRMDVLYATCFMRYGLAAY
jgi:DNA repair photolyase